MPSTIFARHSLKTRITLSTLAIFLVSFWSLAFYANRTLREDMQRLLSEQQFSTVSYIATDINQQLGDRLGVLKTVAGRVSPAILGNTAALQAFLEERPFLQGTFTGGVIAYRLDGTAIAEVPLSAGRIGVNYLNIDTIAAALKEGKSTIGRPVIGKKLLAPVFGITVPIHDPQGNVIGALAGVTNLSKSNFLDRITENRYGKSGGYVLVAPQNRMIVTASGKSRIMEALPAPGIVPTIDRFVQGFEGTDIFVNQFGMEVLVSVKGVPLAGWYVAVTLPTEEAFAPIRDIQQRMLLATIFLTLLAGGLTWWMLRRQLLPMLAAAKALGTQSDSNQSPQPLAITCQDEIGELIGGFNRLLETLVQREVALRESESRLRTVIENEPECIKIVDVQGCLRQMNPAGLAMIGADSLEQVAGQPMLEVIAPEYRNDFADLHKRVLAGEAMQMEFEVLGLKGERRWMETHAVPMQDNGETVQLAVTRDITERKEAMTALAASEAWFRSIFENANTGIASTDSSGRVTDCNQAFCTMLGYDAEALGRMNFAEFTHPDDLKLEINFFDEILAGKRNHYRITKRYIASDGHIVWVDLSTGVIRDARGEADSFIAVVRDITAHKLAEDFLRENTHRLNEAQRISHLGSWTLDLPSGKLSWSDEVFRLFEIDPGQFGATYAAFLDAIHPEDRDAVNQAYAESLANRLPYEITHRLLMADGRIKWVQERCDSEFDAAGEPLRSMGTIQDITARKLVEDALHHAKQQMDFVVTNIPAMVFLKRATDLRFELFNRAGEELLGYSAADILGKNDYDFFPREQADFFTSQDRKVLASQETLEIPEEKITTASGETRYLYTRKIALRDRAGEPLHLLGISIDITARKQVEAELRIAAAAFESQEAMMVTDANSVILRVNRAFTEITGYTSEEVIGETPQLLQSGRHNKNFYQSMWETINRTGVWQGEVWDRRKNGEVYPKWLTISAVKDSAGAVTHYIGTHFDITERKMAEEKINDLAFFDQLTGLPNRTLLMDRLKQTMAASSRSGSYSALMLIDLDNFKTLNDTLGHDIGDLLLKQVAQRMALCLREGDTVARLGGDEFVGVLTGLGTVEGDAATGIETVAKKVLASLNQTYRLGELPYRSTASIGVTLFKGDLASIEDLMKQADLAMYKSKDSGRNTVRFFDPNMESAVKERAELEKDLRRALEEKQFLLHYQAQVVGDGRLTGAEVLVRWQHPQRGMVSPADFIPLAEETGLILPLGQWILETACGQLVMWATQSAMAHLTVAVNVSARQFRQSDFVGQVLAILASTGANPQRLKLELTESLLVHNVEEIIEKMFALKAKGVRFSLDDFGTGYSSLSYLKRLPLDQLKIDQSFVRDVLSDPNDAAIAKTVVALAQSLGLGVIAEGVETELQRDFLANSGCHAYQGYFFSRPLPIDGFEQYAKRC